MKNEVRQKSKGLSRAIKLLAALFVLALIWVVASPFVADFLIVEKKLERADAIWVLSGSTTYIERNQKAATLYKQGIAPKIFLTDDGGHAGWSPKEQRNPKFYELAKRELIKEGVPESAIEALPEQVEGTNYEADAFARIAVEKELNSVLLVTSPYHSRRTLNTFGRAAEKNNLQTTIGIETTDIEPQKDSVWWLSRKGWMTVGGEYVKMFYYWLFY